ncbi:MAG: hypothetical protein D6820_17740, partial [Lentisphaerae bacterium]
AILPPGQSILASLFNLSEEGTQRISYYLFWISPTLVLGALRQWGNGMLVRGKKTGWMSLLKALDLSLVIAWLALGLWLKLAIRHVMIVSVWGTQLISICVLLAVLIKLRHSLPIATGKQPETETKVWRYRELWQYFWPLGLTASLFTFSRPIIYFFASRFHPEDISGELMISALNLAFSFGLLFQSTVNQLRFLIVRFGHKNPVQVARFMAVIATTVSLLMILTLCSPASEYYFRYLQNASGDLLILAREAAWGLCLGPLAIAWRNFFHGLAMIHNQTIYLLYGGIARNGSVLIMGQLLVMMHLFTPFWGAFLIVIAFTAEAMAVTLTSKSWRPDLVSAVS